MSFVFLLRSGCGSPVTSAIQPKKRVTARNEVRVPTNGLGTFTVLDIELPFSGVT
jgi:uncharacterized protein YceK